MAPTGRHRTPGRRIGLALAGGGPEGAVYEIGALRALEDSLEGLDLTALHVYVGVSAGAFIVRATIPIRGGARQRSATSRGGAAIS